MSDGFEHSMYLLLIDPPASPAEHVDIALKEAGNHDLIVAIALIEAIDHGSELASTLDRAGRYRYLAQATVAELERRGIKSSTVAAGESLRLWSDLLVRQDPKTSTLSEGTAIELQSLLRSIQNDLPDLDEAAEIKLVLLQVIDALDAFVVTR
jgi:hypothetical protein